jgi:hypothetical protein
MLYQGKYIRSINKLLHKYIPILPALRYNYPEVVRHFFSPEDSWENVYPTIMPQWDRTPRAGNGEGIYVNATPNHFKDHIIDCLKVVANKQPNHRIVFLKSWNEWGEGNYIEPDQKYGHGFLQAIKESLT